jgi:hypothetical protein
MAEGVPAWSAEELLDQGQGIPFLVGHVGAEQLGQSAEVGG